MAGKGRMSVRRPATKLPHLRKKMDKNALSAKVKPKVRSKGKKSKP